MSNSEKEKNLAVLQQVPRPAAHFTIAKTGEYTSLIFVLLDRINTACSELQENKVGRGEGKAGIQIFNTLQRSQRGSDRDLKIT